MKKIGFVSISFLALILSSAKAQLIPGSYLQLENDIAQLQNDSLNEITFHPSVSGLSDGFTIIDPLFSTSYNSTYPRGYNDGPVWKGKGFTQEIHTGFTIKKKNFRFSLLPIIYFSQNSSFKLASINQLKNKYNYQFRQMAGSAANIDFVQRYGNHSFLKFNFGQTDLRGSFKYAELGLSTQNFTLGPAKKNHLLMSNGGVGFPFVYIKTKDKIEIRINGIHFGNFESFLFYGLLAESEYFDADSKNDIRYINGLSLGYELPNDLGISFGFSKVLYKNTEAFDKRDIYSVFHIADDGIEVNSQGDTIKNTGNDRFDQLASIFFQWKIPGQNARVYFEFGKNDFTGHKRLTLTEFEHNRLYTVGIEKLWNTKGGKFYFLYEHTYLPFFKNYIYRPTNSTYTHTEARQGYTHDGQLLGPGIGPGSVSNMIDMNWQRTSKSWGISFSHIRFDEDYFTTQLPNDDQKIWRHDTEFSLGGKVLIKKAKLDWGLNATLSYRFNTYFKQYNDKVNRFLQCFLRFKILE